MMALAKRSQMALRICSVTAPFRSRAGQWYSFPVGDRGGHARRIRKRIKLQELKLPDGWSIDEEYPKGNG